MPPTHSPARPSRAERRLQPLRQALEALHGALEARDAATIETQLRLARLAAPTGAEAGRAAFVAEALRRRGFPSVHVDEVGNVIARRRGVNDDAAPVVCLAHLDTVFAADTPLVVRQEGPRLVCPGIGDNARGLAGMLALADVFGVPGRDAGALPLAHPVEFVATVGEEGLGNLRGARAHLDALAAQGVTPHAVVTLDGPGDEHIVHQGLGARRFRITFHGPGGHSWSDFGRPNAIHAAGRATHWLAALPAEFRSRVTISVGRIGGGESLTAIPALAWLEVDVRGTDDGVLARAERQLRAIVRQAAIDEQAGRPGELLRTEITLLGERPAGVLDGDHPLVALTAAATRRVGRSPVSVVASTDANVALARGVPAVAIGAGGRGGGAHTADEWFENVAGAAGVGRAAEVVAGAANGEW